MSKGVILFEEERVSVFKLPSVVVNKGHFLDAWKDKIWVGVL